MRKAKQNDIQTNDRTKTKDLSQIQQQITAVSYLKNMQ